jgi:hypothetical protein
MKIAIDGSHENFLSILLEPHAIDLLVLFFLEPSISVTPGEKRKGHLKTKSLPEEFKAFSIVSIVPKKSAEGDRKSPEISLCG